MPRLVFERYGYAPHKSVRLELDSDKETFRFLFFTRVFNSVTFTESQDCERVGTFRRAGDQVLLCEQGKGFTVVTEVDLEFFKTESRIRDWCVREFFM